MTSTTAEAAPTISQSQLFSRLRWQLLRNSLAVILGGSWLVTRSTGGRSGPTSCSELTTAWSADLRHAGYPLYSGAVASSGPRSGSTRPSR